jgi:hypothetical protein
MMQGNWLLGKKAEGKLPIVFPGYLARLRMNSARIPCLGSRGLESLPGD